MTPDQDQFERLWALIEAAANSVSSMSDDEVSAELGEAGKLPGKSVGEIIAVQLQKARAGGASIAPGSQVRLRTDPTRGGRVQPGEKVQAGRRMLEVQFLDGGVRWLPENALEIVPEAAPPLVDRFAAGRLVAPDWLRRTMARIRVTGRLSDVFYSMEATETDFYAYQYKPVLKLLNSPTDALLIADEVGLGKTIEAGLIWTELRARIEANRLLVMCPKTLCDKWQIELDRRFGVDARIVDAAELIQLLSRSNGHGFAAIASMQSLRPPRGWENGQDEDEQSSERPRQRLAHLLDEAADGQPLVDLLVIDEAHHMRNPETLLHTLAQMVNAVSSYRVFLSATPIHLKNRDLYSLLDLIDPDTFEFENTLEELIRTNAPIVQARDLLMKHGAPVSDILEKVQEARQYELLSDSKALQLVEDELKGTLDSSKRAEMAARLEQANQLANYITRTRRRDQEEFRIRREPMVPPLRMETDERAFYDAVTEEVTAYARAMAANERFLLSMPQRLLTSSPAAASAYWAAYGGHSEAIEETDDDLDDKEADDRPLVSRIAAVARRMNFTARLEAADTKYHLLISQLWLLWEDQPDAKVVVFSSFKPTLQYLKRRLATEAIGCELLHGSVKESRTAILNRFRTKPESKVLLSSEVGSEGIDLQFCWVIVNYDLPWNPMRLEQRIGRVDRLGQKSPKVVILNLIYEGTIDQLIYQRLYERLGIGERALGEFEAVLGEPIREMTQKLLDPTLTQEQKAEAIDKARQVVANRQKDEDTLEAEAGSLIRHGDYVLERIRETRDLNRWLHADDILVYVRDRMQRSFAGCSVEAAPPGKDTYSIVLSTAARDAFNTFLARRGLRGATRLLEGSDQMRYQFSSSVVRGPAGQIEVISQVHPLVRFAAELDRRDERGNQSEPVAASLLRGNLKLACEPGVFVVAIRRWIGNSADGRTTSTSRLAYSGAALAGATRLSPELAEGLAAAAAEHGKLLYNVASDARIRNAAALLRDVVLPELDQRFEDFFAQITAEIEDRTSIRRKAIERHRDSKTESLVTQQERNRLRADAFDRAGDERRARQLMSLNVAIDGKLRKLRDTCEMRLKEIDAQRDVIPESEEIASLFVEVTE